MKGIEMVEMDKGKGTVKKKKKRKRKREEKTKNRFFLFLTFLCIANSSTHLSPHFVPESARRGSSAAEARTSVPNRNTYAFHIAPEPKEESTNNKSNESRATHGVVEPIEKSSISIAVNSMNSFVRSSASAATYVSPFIPFPLLLFFTPFLLILLLLSTSLLFFPLLFFPLLSSLPFSYSLLFSFAFTSPLFFFCYSSSHFCDRYDCITS